MGMFDEIRCQMPLPKEGCAGLVFQTKDMPGQWLNQYEIRSDGSLWHEDYDSKEWERCEMTGEVRFYTYTDKNDPSASWVEFSAYFVHGLLAHPIVAV